MASTRDQGGHGSWGADLGSAPPSVGDPRTYREVFARFAPGVRGFLIRRGLPPATADELTQDVMLTVWSKAEQYDVAKAPIRTWVFTIARNRCIDHLRKSRRPTPEPDDPCWVESMHQPDGPEAMAVAHRREARLQRALSTLNEDQRQALRKLYFEGQSTGEAATELGVPVGTVKSRTRRALAALRTVLAEGGVDHD